jgi:hypothetical protein
MGVSSRVAGAAGRYQPALGVIAINEGAIEGEIAVAVVARRHRTYRRILIEVVRGVGHRRGRRRRIRPIAVVGRGLGREPVQRVVGVGDRRAGPGLPRQNIAVGIVGEHFRAGIGIGRGREPVEPIGVKLVTASEREKWRITPSAQSTLRAGTVIPTRSRITPISASSFSSSNFFDHNYDSS